MKRIILDLDELGAEQFKELLNSFPDDPPLERLDLFTAGERMNNQAWSIEKGVKIRTERGRLPYRLAECEAELKRFHERFPACVISIDRRGWPTAWQERNEADSNAEQSAAGV